jgi:thioredoxin reductase
MPTDSITDAETAPLNPSDPYLRRAQTFPTLTDEQHDRVPHALETSRRGVFAVGDVRSGSVKRVASSVGEVSIVVSAIHAILA